GPRGARHGDGCPLRDPRPRRLRGRCRLLPLGLARGHDAAAHGGAAGLGAPSTPDRGATRPERSAGTTRRRPDDGLGVHGGARARGPDAGALAGERHGGPAPDRPGAARDRAGAGTARATAPAPTGKPTVPVPSRPASVVREPAAPAPPTPARRAPMVSASEATPPATITPVVRINATASPLEWPDRRAGVQALDPRG